MIKHALKTLLSTPLMSRRMAGRSWTTEFAARVTHRLFAEGTNLPVTEFRKKLNAIATPHAALKQVKFTSLKMADIDCLRVMPIAIKGAAKRHEKVIVYIHGGGYTVGSPTSYKTFLAQIAVAANAVVIAPDYRLSPEHPFPAAQDDCLAVVRAVHQDHAKAALVIAGDSAGGALALNTALSLAQGDDTQQIVEALLLLSPWVEPTAESGSVFSNTRNDIFDTQFLDLSYRAHMQEADLFDTRVNFLNADLSRLPQIYIQVAGGELFIDQINDFHQRAVAAGVDIAMDVFATQFHVFQVIAPILDDSKDAMAKIADFLQTINP